MQAAILEHSESQFGLGRNGPDWTELDWFGLDWTGLVWTGLVRSGLVWSGQV